MLVKDMASSINAASAVFPTQGLKDGPAPLNQNIDSVNTSGDDELLQTGSQSTLEVRTLFVSGLPMDAKPRELYLLFRAYKGFESGLLKIMGKNIVTDKNNYGYESSLLKITNKNGKNTSPVGFVTFSSRMAAETAKQDLQGVRFDPDLPQTLRLEFAKSNTKVTKLKHSSPQSLGTSTTTIIHPITGQELGAALFSGAPEAWAAAPTLTPFAELAPLPPQVAGFQHAALFSHHHPATLAHMPLRPTLTYSWPYPSLSASPIPSSLPSTSPSSLSLSSPSSTLFVANLGQFSSEQELKDLFSSFQGFLRVRMHNKGGSPVAFVEFQDVRQAQEAMTRLQGFVLLSSDRGGIRIEFAKTKMGELYFLPPQFPGAKEIPIVQSPVSMAAVF